MLIFDHHSRAIGWRWPHFSAAEMASRRDGSLRIDPAFLDWLEEVRAEFGRPMPVSSGYRTPKQQEVLPGHKRTGAHVAGQAVDVLVSGARARELVDIAIRHGVLGLGIAQAPTVPKQSRYLHLDRWSARLGSGRFPAIWSY